MRGATWRFGLAAVIGLVAGGVGRARAGQVITFDAGGAFASGSHGQSLAVDGYVFTPRNGEASFL